MSAENMPLKQETRRSMLHIATGAVAAAGCALAAWPFVMSFGPDASVIPPLEIDPSLIPEGEERSFKWNQTNLVLRHRKAKEVEATSQRSLEALPDELARNMNLPEEALAYDSNRCVPDQPDLVLLESACPHEGCMTHVVDKSVAASWSDRRSWAHWECPCCGSGFDASGRCVYGPAVRNMRIPPYRVLSDGKLLVGV